MPWAISDVSSGPRVLLGLELKGSQEEASHFDFKRKETQTFGVSLCPEHEPERDFPNQTHMHTPTGSHAHTHKWGREGEVSEKCQGGLVGRLCSTRHGD